MFSDLANSGASPILEQMVRFSAQRQRVIAHNIANIDTPNFIQMDASVPDFQRNLAEAIEQRRNDTGGETGGLPWQETAELQKDDAGRLRLIPQDPGQGVLLHDRNNRNLERLMQNLAENTATFRLAVDLLKNRNDMLRAAIAQRA